MTVEVYTDGSGTTGGPGGVGYVAVIGDLVIEASLPLPHATNQQAEILAAAYALDQIDPCDSVTVWTDSEYVVLGWHKLDGWIRRGWRLASGGSVKNQPHWRRLITAAARHKDVHFEWLKGHAGHEWNERADVLAGEARQEAKLQAAGLA